MAKFLNTSATTHYLDQMITHTRERLIIISPYLKLNDRIRELLTDRDRFKIPMDIVYGKKELPPQEMNWLRTLGSARIHFCANLHAKCYLNEQEGIIASMNLYDFSLANNNEMGVHFTKAGDGELYRETWDEAQRLIRLAKTAPLSAEKADEPEQDHPDGPSKGDGKLTTSNLAKKLGISTIALTDRLVAKGLVIYHGDQFRLTDLGRAAGGELRESQKYGPFFLWPQDIDIEQAKPSKQERVQPSGNKRAPTQPPGILDTIATAFKVAFVGGKCIRCEGTIDYDPDKPLCGDCFKVWNRYKDPHHEERYCHRCGAECATTLARPLCDSCYQAVTR